MEAERFVLDQLVLELREHGRRLRAIEAQLRKFAAKAPAAEAEARAVLASIPGVGAVTVDVVVSELAEISRFRSAKRVCAYAGLAPGQRESAGRAKNLGITKEGSRLLRWVLVEAAWRLAWRTPRWKTIFEGLARRRGRKKAIVAVARRLLCVMFAMLRTGRAYQPALVS
jgi:transposase